MPTEFNSVLVAIGVYEWSRSRSSGKCSFRVASPVVGDRGEEASPEWS